MCDINSAVLKLGEGPVGRAGIVITVNVYDNFIYQRLLRRLPIIGAEQGGTASQGWS